MGETGGKLVGTTPPSPEEYSASNRSVSYQGCVPWWSRRGGGKASHGSTPSGVELDSGSSSVPAPGVYHGGRAVPTIPLSGRAPGHSWSSRPGQEGGGLNGGTKEQSSRLRHRRSAEALDRRLTRIVPLRTKRVLHRREHRKWTQIFAPPSGGGCSGEGANLLVGGFGDVRFDGPRGAGGGFNAVLSHMHGSILHHDTRSGGAHLSSAGPIRLGDTRAVIAGLQFSSCDSFDHNTLPTTLPRPKGGLGNWEEEGFGDEPAPLIGARNREEEDILVISDGWEQGEVLSRAPEVVEEDELMQQVGSVRMPRSAYDEIYVKLRDEVLMSAQIEHSLEHLVDEWTTDLQLNSEQEIDEFMIQTKAILEMLVRSGFITWKRGDTGDTTLRVTALCASQELVKQNHVTDSWSKDTMSFGVINESPKKLHTTRKRGRPPTPSSTPTAPIPASPSAETPEKRLKQKNHPTRRLNDFLLCMSFNLEGIATAGKLAEALGYASKKRAKLVVFQETYSNTTGHFDATALDGSTWRIYECDEGLKGGSRDEKGGTAVAVHMSILSSVEDILIEDNRLMGIMLDLAGGGLGVINVHLPDNMKDDELKLKYADALNRMCVRMGKYRQILVAGDLNLRLEGRLEGEDPHIGPHIHGKGVDHIQVREQKTPEKLQNRAQWVSWMQEHDFLHLNSAFAHAPHQQVTYKEPGFTDQYRLDNLARMGIKVTKGQGWQESENVWTKLKLAIGRGAKGTMRLEALIDDGKLGINTIASQTLELHELRRWEIMAAGLSKESVSLLDNLATIPVQGLWRLLKSDRVIDPQNWATLDHILTQRAWKHRIQDVWSDARANLHSSHSPVLAKIHLSVAQNKVSGMAQGNSAALGDAEVRKKLKEELGKTLPAIIEE